MSSGPCAGPAHAGAAGHFDVMNMDDVIGKDLQARLGAWSSSWSQGAEPNDLQVDCAQHSA